MQHRIFCAIASILLAFSAPQLGLVQKNQPVQQSETAQIAAEQHHITENALLLHVSYDHQQQVCLARNIYFEARGESLVGQMAVAYVTINRAKDDYFPKDICSVVNEKHTSDGHTVCQFSWVCESQIGKVYDQAMYNKVQKVAETAYVNYYKGNGKVPDIVEGATYYHTKSIKGYVGGSRAVVTAQIDNHIFYRVSKSL